MPELVPIKDEEVDNLDQLVLWLKQEYPDKMVIDDISDFDRLKLAGATELALYLIDMIKLNKGELL